jgi:hypothetical protein
MRPGGKRERAAEDEQNDDQAELLSMKNAAE